MRRTRDTLGLLFLLLVGLHGCALHDSEVKPPRPPEEFRAPPDNDPRYSKAIEYPKETMVQDKLKRQRDPGKNVPGPITSPRMQGGMPMPGGY